MSLANLLMEKHAMLAFLLYSTVPLLFLLEDEQHVLKCPTNLARANGVNARDH